jgi:hypothetical protein
MVMLGAPKNWSPRARITILVDAGNESVLDTVEFEASRRALLPDAAESWYFSPAPDGLSAKDSASMTTFVAPVVVALTAAVVVVSALVTIGSGAAAAGWVEAAWVTMALFGGDALPVTVSGSRRVAAKSVSESDVPSGVAGTCPAGAELVATALVTADDFGVVPASTEVDVTPTDSPDGVCVFEACVAAVFERAVVAGRWLVVAGRWLPLVPAS